MKNILIKSVSNGLHYSLSIILHPLQNISKNWSTKMNVFSQNFELNTSGFFNSLLLIFCSGGSKMVVNCNWFVQWKI
jgi:hypothetical protein